MKSALSTSERAIFSEVTSVSAAGLPAPVRSKVLAAQFLAPMLAIGIGKIAHPVQFLMQFPTPLGGKLLVPPVNLAEP
jgi:hypothetical protein